MVCLKKVLMVQREMCVFVAVHREEVGGGRARMHGRDGGHQGPGPI